MQIITINNIEYIKAEDIMAMKHKEFNNDCLNTRAFQRENNINEDNFIYGKYVSKEWFKGEAKLRTNKVLIQRDYYLDIIKTSNIIEPVVEAKNTTKKIITKDIVEIYTTKRNFEFNVINIDSNKYVLTDDIMNYTPIMNVKCENTRDFVKKYNLNFIHAKMIEIDKWIDTKRTNCKTDKILTQLSELDKMSELNDIIPKDNDGIEQLQKELILNDDEMTSNHLAMLLVLKIYVNLYWIQKVDIKSV